MRIRVYLFLLSVGVVSAACLGTGDESPTEPARSTGSLRVATSTSGEDLDRDGYTITMDGPGSISLGVNDARTFTQLRSGDHSIELSELRSNCSSLGANPKTVTVPGGASASVTFTIDCRARVGAVKVTATTTGEDRDTDGYAITVDDSLSGRVDPDGSVVFEGLDEGVHRLELSGVRKNCSADRDSTWDVSVSFDATSKTAFSVDCERRAGDLEVRASTSGEDLDADGYEVVVDGSSSRTLSVDGSTEFEDLDEDDHEVGLEGLRSNCEAEGDNPRTASVRFDSTTTVAFSVTCTARTGDLEVSASTSGEDRDADGYTVIVDGSHSRSIGPDGTTTFSDLGEEDHEVSLSGVKGNCAVEGENPRTVPVSFESTESTTFSVACEASGVLEVSASTSGEDQDKDGYIVTVGDTVTGSIGPNGSTAFTELAEGEYAVELSDVRDNCSLDGGNSRTVRVPAGSTASTAFSVDCAPRTGDVEVTASTSGRDVDADGYTVTVDDTLTGSVGTNGSRTFTELAEGSHDVELSDIQDNCAVDGENPRTVSVPFDTTGTTSFSVKCRAANGEVAVSVETSGDTTDTDGYTVTLNGDESRSKAVEPSGSVTFTGLTGGEHTVELSGVQVNCEVLGGRRRTVSVAGDEPDNNAVGVGFTVDCEPALFNRIVYVAPLAIGTQLVSFDVDGSDFVSLDTGPRKHFTPEVSPDGTKVVFVSDRDGTRELYVLRLDGSEPDRVTTNSKRESSPSWSPDGDRIVFERVDSFRDRNLYVINSDGGDPKPLEEPAPGSKETDPTWGPGGYIYFVSDRDGDKEIFRIRPDGTGIAQLTQNSGMRDLQPTVAADGSRIAFVRAGGRSGEDREIFTMEPNGEDVRRVTDNDTPDFSPDFSPDAEWIVFVRPVIGSADEIFRIDADGTDALQLTKSKGVDSFPVFTPFR